MKSFSVCRIYFSMEVVMYVCNIWDGWWRRMNSERRQGEGKKEKISFRFYWRWCESVHDLCWQQRETERFRRTRTLLAPTCTPWRTKVCGCVWAMFTSHGKQLLWRTVFTPPTDWILSFFGNRRRKQKKYVEEIEFLEISAVVNESVLDDRCSNDVMRIICPQTSMTLRKY